MILELEDKYKGKEFLCTTPYTRKRIVIAQYLFLVIWFLLCSIIHTFIALILPNHLKLLDFTTIASSAMILSLFFSIFIPLFYKYGYQKTRIIATIAIVTIPYSLPALISYLNKKGFSFDFQQYISSSLFSEYMLITSLALICISVILSIKIYNKKDL